MKDPLHEDLRAMRRVRIKNLRELIRHPEEAHRGDMLDYTLGHDVVDLSTGVRIVLFKAHRTPDDDIPAPVRKRARSGGR
jgi:hypothetical protein